MLLQSFLRSHFPLLGCPDDLCYVRVVDYSHTDKVTPSKVFAPPAVIQPLTIASAGGLIRRSAQSIFQQVVVSVRASHLVLEMHFIRLQDVSV
jgi:hypothetical protein